MGASDSLGGPLPTPALGRRVLLLLAVLALTIVAFGSLSVALDRSSEEAAARKRSSQQVDVLALHVEQWLLPWQRGLRAAAAELQAAEGAAARAAALRRAAQALQPNEALALLDARGHLMATTHAGWPGPLAAAHRGVLESLSALNGNGQTVLPAWAPADAGYITLVQGVPDVGLLVARVSGNALQRFFAAAQSERGERLLLLGSLGHPVLELPGSTAPSDAGAAAIFEVPQGQTWVGGNMQGRLYTWRGVATGQLAVAVSERRAELMAAFRQRTVQRLLVVVLALAMLMLGTSRLLLVLRDQRGLLRERHEAAARWRSLVEMSTDWYWQQDAELRYVHVGEQFTQISGMPVDTLLGRQRWDFPATNMSDDDWARHRADLQARRPFRNLVLRRENGNGNVDWCELSGEPIFDDSGQFTGYRGVGRDITARRVAEQQQEQLSGQLRESQKMEALGTLAGGIAHDFNNILGAILGNLVLARAALAGPHPAAAALEHIQGAAERARHLVQQILAFGRRQAQSLRVQALAPMVHETVSLLQATLPAMVTLKVDIRAPEVCALADATQMHQVLLNLCTNAWHALPQERGTIEVGLENVVLTAGAWPGVDAGAHAHLWVRDSGRGMGPETLRRMFEPFFTTKPLGQGTGLGLAVVHGIVRAHHGTLQVDSEVGRGSCFHIYLPAREDQGSDTVMPAGPVPALLPADLGQGRHLLSVDDDAVLRLTTSALLQQWGFRVTSVASGEAALQALETSAQRPFDAVVSDHNMPGMSGLALFHCIRRCRPELPVIISSGHLTQELRDAARREPGLVLLEKECQHDKLAPLLQRLLQAAPARDIAALPA